MLFIASKRAIKRAVFLGIFLAGGLLSTAAKSAEATFSAPMATEELRDRLTASSAIMASGPQDTVQELMAAALSDYRTLVQVLYDAGHFSPVVNIRVDGREAAYVSQLSIPQAIRRIDISVTPGPAFTFGRAEIAPLPKTEDLELPPTFASGHPASTGVIRDAADAGVKAWREEGHAKVRLSSQQITANHRTSELHARLGLTPGPRLRFGTLHLNSSSRVRDDAIHRIAGFPTGEVFSPDQVSKAANRLRRTGTFSAVTIREAEVANADGTLDFSATLEDLPPRQLTFGAELSSADGLEITASWMHRNLFKGAEKLRFEARLRGLGGSSDIDGRIALRLDRPATLGPDDNTFYLLEAERLDEEHYTAIQGLGGIGVRRVISDRFFLEGALAFNSVLAEDVFGKRRFKYVLASLRAEKEGRDNPVNATEGYYFNARATPFWGVDDTASGVKIDLDGRAYRSLGGSDRLVLAGRVQLGSVIGPSLNEVSPTMLYFAGGAGSVRGHEYQSLGVPVAGGTAGGRGYLALSGELRGKVTEKLSLVGFYDLGFVDADSFVSSDSTHIAGAGIGVRYNVTGIGPLRFDLAYPVNGDANDGVQFYIGIGQAF